MHDGVKAMRFLQNFLRSKRAIFLVSALVLILAILISLCVGVVMYTPADIFQMPDILRYIRFPRVTAAVFAGAGLAGAGVIIQTLLGNYLAGPNIIGVNSGAGFMTLIAALIFPLVPQLQPLAAFVGALFSVMLIYLLSRQTGTSKMTILLSGVVLNALLNAASEALCTFFPDVHMSYAAFRVGGLSTVQTSVLYPAALLIAVLFVIVQCRPMLWNCSPLAMKLHFPWVYPLRNTVCYFLSALQAWRERLSALQVSLAFLA